MTGQKDFDEWGNPTNIESDDDGDLEGLEEVPALSLEDDYATESTEVKDTIDDGDEPDDDDLDEDDTPHVDDEDEEEEEPELEFLFDLGSEGDDLGDDLGDDYWSYVEEEMGYTDIDRDTLPEKEVDLHDRIRAIERLLSLGCCPSRPGSGG